MQETGKESEESVDENDQAPAASNPDPAFGEKPENSDDFEQDDEEESVKAYTPDKMIPDQDAPDDKKDDSLNESDPEDENENEDEKAFEYTEKTDGYVITLTADAGILHV